MITEYRFRALEARIAALEGNDAEPESTGDGPHHRFEKLETEEDWQNAMVDPFGNRSSSTEDAANWIIHIDGAAHKVTQAVHGEFARMRQLLRDAGSTGDGMNPFPPIRPHHIEDRGDEITPAMIDAGWKAAYAALKGEGISYVALEEAIYRVMTAARESGDVCESHHIAQASEMMGEA